MVTATFEIEWEAPYAWVIDREQLFPDCIMFGSFLYEKSSNSIYWEILQEKKHYSKRENYENLIFYGTVQEFRNIY